MHMFHKKMSEQFHYPETLTGTMLIYCHWSCKKNACVQYVMTITLQISKKALKYQQDQIQTQVWVYLH